MADFPFVSHDPEFNATVILKRNITPSSEKSKGLKNVCTILMHKYFYTYIKYRKEHFSCVLGKEIASLLYTWL